MAKKINLNMIRRIGFLSKMRCISKMISLYALREFKTQTRNLRPCSVTEMERKKLSFSKAPYEVEKFMTTFLNIISIRYWRAGRGSSEGILIS